MVTPFLLTLGSNSIKINKDIKVNISAQISMIGLPSAESGINIYSSKQGIIASAYGQYDGWAFTVSSRSINLSKDEVITARYYFGTPTSWFKFLGDNNGAATHLTIQEV